MSAKEMKQAAPAGNRNRDWNVRFIVLLAAYTKWREGEERGAPVAEANARARLSFPLRKRGRREAIEARFGRQAGVVDGDRAGSSLSRDIGELDPRAKSEVGAIK